MQGWVALKLRSVAVCALMLPAIPTLLLTRDFVDVKSDEYDFCDSFMQNIDMSLFKGKCS